MLPLLAQNSIDAGRSRLGGNEVGVGGGAGWGWGEGRKVVRCANLRSAGKYNALIVLSQSYVLLFKSETE